MCILLLDCLITCYMFSELAKTHNILFSTDHCILSTREGKELLKQKQQNGVYIFYAMAAKVEEQTYSLKEAHELLGHLIIKLSEQWQSWALFTSLGTD